MVISVNGALANMGRRSSEEDRMIPLDIHERRLAQQAPALKLE